MGDDAEDENSEDGEDDDEKPNRTDNDDFFDFVLNAFKFDYVVDAENTDRRGAIPSDAREAAGFRHDNVIILGILFVSEEFLIAKEWEDLQSVFDGGVNVTEISDCGATGDFAREEKAWDVKRLDFALTNGFTGNFGVDDMGHFVDVPEARAAVGVAGFDDDGEVLAAGRGVLRDSDSGIDVLSLVWL